MNKEDHHMANQDRAERIKKIILDQGTYEQMEFLTGIGTRTLIRIATGKTEPKSTDLEKIAKATNTSMDWICFGDVKDIKSKAGRDFIYALDASPDDDDLQEITDMHHHIIWNLRLLTKDDIRTVGKVIDALTTHNYVYRKNAKKMSEIFGE